MGLQFTNALKVIFYVQNVMIVLESVLFAGNLMKGLPLETDLLKILPNSISAKPNKTMNKIKEFSILKGFAMTNKCIIAKSRRHFVIFV